MMLMILAIFFQMITKIITMILKGGHLNRRAAATLVDGRVRLSTKVVLCQHFEKLVFQMHRLETWTPPRHRQGVRMPQGHPVF